MEGKRYEWIVFDEQRAYFEHRDVKFYKSLHQKQLDGYSSDTWFFDMGLDAYKPMEIDPDLARRQAMDRIRVQIENLEVRISDCERDHVAYVIVNRLKNEQRQLKEQWDNLHRQAPKQWSPVEQRPQQEQTEKCVIYYIGGPWDMVKKIEEKKPNDAAFVDVVEHASFWDGKEDAPKTQKATYRLQRLKTTVPICDGLPVFAAVYKGLADDDIPF